MNIYCRRTVLGHLLRLTLIVVLCFLTMPTPANSKKKNHGPYWEWKIKGNMQALVKKSEILILVDVCLIALIPFHLCATGGAHK